jgi:hypothetical protein
MEFRLKAEGKRGGMKTGKTAVFSSVAVQKNVV